MIFVGATRGFEFSCEFRNRNYESVGTAYTCYYPQVSVSNNSLSLENVSGNHLPDRNNDDVTALHVFKEKTLTKKLPKNIDRFFPNLEVIVWEAGYLTSVTADDLRVFPALKVLNLYINELTSLDANLFQLNPELSWISFSFNLIAHVGQNLLSNLNNLSHVNFNNNVCINETARTTQEIQELNVILTSKCSLSTTTSPPTTTTTTSLPTTSTATIKTTESACYIRCSVNNEIDDQNIIISEQGRAIDILNGVVNGLVEGKEEQTGTIEGLQQKITDQDKLINNFEKRIVELEKQMIEILAKP